MPTLSVCLIVKNEEEVLERCLSCISRFADEIIVVDTGSTDDTLNICGKFPVKLSTFIWTDDFSAARNYSFERATMDYIFWMDADDILKEEDIAAMHALKNSLSKDVYFLKYDYSQDETGTSLCVLYRERIVRNIGVYRWRYPVHEVIECNDAPSKEFLGITITHQRTPKGHAADKTRNLEILKKHISSSEYRDDPRMWYYLGKEYDDHGYAVEGLDAYKKSLEIGTGWIEDRVWACIRIARCYHGLGNREAYAYASSYAKQAIKLDPRMAEPYFILGRLAFEDELYEEAIFWFEKCIRPVPDILSPVDQFSYSLYPFTHLTFCYDAMKDYQRAAYYNEKALALKPDDAGLLHNRTYLRAALNEPFAAVPVKALNFSNGLFRKEHHINCHVAVGEHVDLVCDPERLFFYDETIAAINEEYSLSYLPVSKTPDILKQWYRVLVKGGRLTLREHDLAGCAEKFYKSKTAEESNWYRHILYGFQGGREYDPQLSRISGFTQKEWINHLSSAGFSVSRVTEREIHGTPSIEIVAVKNAYPADAKIGWMVGSEPLDDRFPTYRIRAKNIDRALNEMGFASELVYDVSDEGLRAFQILIFFRAINRDEHDLMIKMKGQGKKVVFDIAEDLLEFQHEFPYYIPMLQLADVVVCCSHQLAEKLKDFNPNVRVVEDAVETEISYNAGCEDRGRLKVGWVGMADNHLHAEKLRPLIEECGYELVTIHNGDDASVRWEMDTWQRHLEQCAIAIAPADAERQPCKSNNRVTTYMALGMPVIAAPLDAYKRIIRHGVNGFIAESAEDWKACLLALRDDLLRRQMGGRAVCTSLKFRPKNIALKLARVVLGDVYNSRAIDIIIPTIYNPEHLRVCVESIIACTQTPFSIIVINNGGHAHLKDECIQTIDADGLNYSASVNLGIAAGSAPKICIMNDDVIVSDGWLEPMLETVESESIGFCNPLSNSEFGIQHACVMRIGEVELLHCNNYLREGKIYQKDKENGGVYSASIYTYVPVHVRRMLPLEWVAFFCTVTTRKVIETIGLLDDQFNNGSEDVDLCYRAKRMGLGSVVNENSFVFHFGGTSTERYRAAAADRKDETQRLLEKKYAAPLLVIYTGFSFEPWNGSTIEQQGIGGSETAAARVAVEFSKLGYRVVLFCDCTGMEGVVDGVEYRNISSFRHFIDRHFIDVFILSRQIDVMDYPIRAAKKFFWAHDVCAMGTELGEGDLVRKYQQALDGIFCLSPWHKGYFAGIHGIDDRNIFVTHNGIDTSRFVSQCTKERNRFVYSSSPDRSLDTVLRIFPKIRQQLPDASLHIYYGFDNFEKAILYSGDAAKKALYEEIMVLMQQPGVFYHGRVGQKELAEELLKSDIWLYPTQFTETYCITALEAQMAGVLCVCSATGALATTVGDRGILLTGEPGDHGYEDGIVQEIMDIQANAKKKQQLLQKAKDWASRQTWSKVASDWHALFHLSDLEVADHIDV